MAATSELSKAQEKKVAAVAEAYPDNVWATRYARKVLKVKLGLRTTPAPIPSELDKDAALAIEGMIGYERPKKVRQTRSSQKSNKKAEAATEETPVEETPVEDVPAEDAGPLA